MKHRFEFWNDDFIESIECHSQRVALNHAIDLAIVKRQFISVYAKLYAVKGVEETAYLQFLGSFSGDVIARCD